MAKQRKTKRARTTASSARARKARARNGSGRDDAIALLKADHREVERLFGKFESARAMDQKEELAEQICQALTMHATIEEEIFYPAFLEATDETDIHHEAEIEHEGAKRLIAEIEAEGSRDDHFEARVTVLSEMIKHHVKEEEQRGGMFSKAQRSGMDLVALGQRLRERKLELAGESADDFAAGARRPPLGSRRELRARSS